MENTPPFFVPEATPEEQESVYAEMAAICGRPVPDQGRRIYSITYVHDREEWTATIGKRLQGVRRRVTRSRGKRTERNQPVSDPAVVLAIFAGVPYMVLTNWNVGSAWENPFMAGKPRSVTYFSTT
jgi:hypothetical protein